MNPISICVIAKDEEKNLKKFFESIKENLQDYPHEIIFVDTGSMDRTVEIAQQYTDYIYNFQWQNDFSEARNFSIKKANYDWIFVLDCDENLLKFDIDNVQELTKYNGENIGLITRYDHRISENIDKCYQAKLGRFFNRKYFHYEGRIHEQLKSNDGRNYDLVKTFIEVEHTGYIGTQEFLAKKADRNISLLKAMLIENEKDPYLYFQLGQACRMAKRLDEACEYYVKGLNLPIDTRLEYVQTMVVSYGNTLVDLERYGEALELEKIYEVFDHIADFLCLMGIIYLRTGFVAEAIREFTKATTTIKFQVEGANTFIPYYNLACIYETLGEVEKAKKLYTKCGEFVPAKERLYALNQED